MAAPARVRMPRQERRDYVAHGEVWQRLSALQSKLEALRKQPQKTTGHAFVVFQLEEQRNAFLASFQRPTLGQMLLRGCGRAVRRAAAVCGGRTPPGAAHVAPTKDPRAIIAAVAGRAPSARLNAVEAPEPEDVRPY